MTWDWGVGQSRGKRPEQQDVCLVKNDCESTLPGSIELVAAVADGMGGEKDGAKTATTVVNEFFASYCRKDPSETIAAALKRSVRAAHEAALAVGGGSTLVAAVLNGWTIHWVSVGDSRAYLFRNRRLFHLTTDHNHSFDLFERVAAGEMTRQQALAQRGKEEELTSAMGLGLRHIDRNIHPFVLGHKDQIILCTDGIYSAFKDDVAFANFCGLDDRAEACCAAILKAVEQMDHPNQDNCTVVVLKSEQDRGGTVPRVP